MLHIPWNIPGTTTRVPISVKPRLFASQSERSLASRRPRRAAGWYLRDVTRSGAADWPPVVCRPPRAANLGGSPRLGGGPGLSLARQNRQSAVPPRSVRDVSETAAGAETDRPTELSSRGFSREAAAARSHDERGV